jgi:hypothetical protein
MATATAIVKTRNIFTDLKENNPKLTTVILNFKNKSSKQILKDFTKLRSILPKNNYLNEIILKNTAFYFETMTILGDDMLNISMITSLTLDNNNIDDICMIALSKALEINSHLEYIKLNNCNISNDGAIALSKALKINKSLHIVDLNGNNIGHEGINALVDAMINNSYDEEFKEITIDYTSLRTIIIQINLNITKEMIISIIKILKENINFKIIRLLKNVIVDDDIIESLVSIENNIAFIRNIEFSESFTTYSKFKPITFASPPRVFLGVDIHIYLNFYSIAKYEKYYDIYNSISNKFKIININQFWNPFIHHNFSNNSKYLVSKTQFDNFVIGCLLINNHYCINLPYDVWVQIFSFIMKKDICLYKKVFLC